MCAKVNSCHEQDFRTQYQKLQKSYASLPLAPTADTPACSEFVAVAYDTIWSHSTSDSPYLHHARVIVESSAPEQVKCTLLLGVLQGLRSEIDRLGYFRVIEESEAYESYDRFASTLRNWLIAYGVGSPVLLYTNESLSARLLTTKDGSWVAVLFLSGVLVQVIKAGAYKVASWWFMDYRYVPEKEAGPDMKLGRWLSESTWLDILLDVVTVVLFACATRIALRVVGTAPSTGAWALCLRSMLSA